MSHDTEKTRCHGKAGLFVPCGKIDREADCSSAATCTVVFAARRPERGGDYHRGCRERRRRDTRNLECQ